MKLFGITHRVDDGTPIMRLPKLLKVSIGLPVGPAIKVWIGPTNEWHVSVGTGNAAKVSTFKTATEAEKFYWPARRSAPMVKYPSKINHFTFTKPVVENEREAYVPDFPAIERHGATPRSVDIVFLDDDPLNGSYQMWSQTELKCKGDGIDAMRHVTIADTEDEKESAKMAAANGEKYYAIKSGCWTCNCPYAKESAPGKPSPCKPGGDLRFQLVSDLRVGGYSYFHTTGFRSIAQLFSCLEQIKALTGGRLAGVPLQMVLRPYKTNHNGQAATQYGVHLQFRAESMAALRRNLIEQAIAFRIAAIGEEKALPAAESKMIEGPAESAGIEEGEDAPMSAGAMVAEFYPDGIADGETEEVPTNPTDQKAAGLAERIKEAGEKK